MGKYFGTDGFRGEANVKLTADHAFRVAEIFCLPHNLQDDRSHRLFLSLLHTVCCNFEEYLHKL